MFENIRSLGTYRRGSSRDRYPIAREKLDALPYASLGVQLEGSQRAVMILASADGDITTWCSAADEQLRFDGPTLVGTLGLPRDLLDTRWHSASPLSTLAAGATLGPIHVRTLDVRDGHGVDHDVAVFSRYRDEGIEIITIDGVPQTCRRISESADVPRWRWQTKNEYWIDVDEPRQLWRSVFGYAPDMPSITVETLKKYRG